MPLSVGTTFSATITLTNGKSAVMSLQKDPEKVAANKVAQNLLIAMGAVETSNGASSGADATCIYDSGQQKVFVQSGPESSEVSAPAPVNSVSCSSSLTQFDATVTTSGGVSVTRSLIK
ncbi:hypothetical protein [Deinococcus roseus]|uniref:Uncharacterized protein n=1 Tax=Deinococcus roseus TaxID=392414 RepID=A0ABQ2D090_9DEIO|nr:hypothetical protein [Deinococcus roseus]GGJ36843.1 hypothetical protein GCM10008938_23630 [Deinococcus roseus]